ncbi:MAG: hypothetical protein YHS30scaffold324_12 [Catenulispora phage 69_17]|jgi:hypothetical protein|nr:MAG: hypothetical protein YHS30scaffold324_12 [Catenulispora phage 69_17]
MQFGIGRFSSYVVDVDALLFEVQRQRHERFAQTARWPCTLQMHPLDWNAVVMHHDFAPGTPDSPGRLFGLAVIRNDKHELGAITLTQCQASLYYRGNCECSQSS